MATSSPIPTIDILPPMSSKFRDLLYGVLAWAAAILTIINLSIIIYPEWDLSRPLTVANIIITGLWTLGGFKAKANVTVGNVDGRHEAA